MSYPELYKVFTTKGILTFMTNELILTGKSKAVLDCSVCDVDYIEDELRESLGAEWVVESNT